MPAVKARPNPQEDKQDDREKFVAFAYLLLPPSQMLLYVSVGFEVLSRDVQGLCVRCLFLVGTIKIFEYLSLTSLYCAKNS
jgi:hypothetical protein